MARTPRQVEDEHLALRCQLGEPGAFAELVETMLERNHTNALGVQEQFDRLSGAVLERGSCR